MFIYTAACYVILIAPFIIDVCFSGSMDEANTLRKASSSFQNPEIPIRKESAGPSYNIRRESLDKSSAKDGSSIVFNATQKISLCNDNSTKGGLTLIANPKNSVHSLWMKVNFDKSLSVSGRAGWSIHKQVRTINIYGGHISPSEAFFVDDFFFKNSVNACAAEWNENSIFAYYGLLNFIAYSRYTSLIPYYTNSEARFGGFSTLGNKIGKRGSISFGAGFLMHPKMTTKENWSCFILTSKISQNDLLLGRAKFIVPVHIVITVLKDFGYCRGLESIKFFDLVSGGINVTIGKQINNGISLKIQVYRLAKYFAGPANLANVVTDNSVSIQGSKNVIIQPNYRFVVPALDIAESIINFVGAKTLVPRIEKTLLPATRTFVKLSASINVTPITFIFLDKYSNSVIPKVIAYVSFTVVKLHSDAELYSNAAYVISTVHHPIVLTVNTKGNFSCKLEGGLEITFLCF